MPPKRARSSGSASSSRAKRRPLASLPLGPGEGEISTGDDGLTLSDADESTNVDHGLGAESHVTADASNALDSATVISTTATSGGVYERFGGTRGGGDSSFSLMGAVVGSVGAVEREMRIIQSRKYGGGRHTDNDGIAEDYDIFPEGEVAGMVVELKRRAEKEKSLRRELHEARRQISDSTIANTRLQVFVLSMFLYCLAPAQNMFSSIDRFEGRSRCRESIAPSSNAI